MEKDHEGMFLLAAFQHNLPLTCVVFMCHLQCHLHSSLPFHPCWALRLFPCSCQVKSVGLFQTELSPRISTTLLTVKCYLPTTLANECVFSPLTYHSVSEQKYSFLAQSSLNLMTWKSSNLCVCFPYIPTLFELKPCDSVKIVSYLVLVDLWPRFRCAHLMDFEGDCQATMPIWLGFSLQI